MPLGSGLRNCIGLWKLAASHAALQVFRAAPEGVVATTGCESVLEKKGSSKMNLLHHAQETASVLE